MDLLNGIVTGVEKIKGLQQGLAKDAFAKKHKARKKFYVLLLDYLNSPGSKSPNNFFQWYVDRLDERMKMAPQWKGVWFSVTKTKNDAGFRGFLENCIERADSEADFKKVIEPWVPDDEYRIIASSTSSDISEVVKIAIDLCDEKEATQKQIHGAIFANIPTIGIGLFFHWIIYTFVYTSFITPGFADSKTWEEMDMLEQNYMRYDWVINNYPFVIAGLIGTVMFLRWSIRSWTNRGIFVREHYIDYLPPYSLVKVNEQYNILMIIASFMRSGKSFAESLEQARKGASPYVQYQVDKIINNDTEQVHVAINTFYLGDYGSDVRERAAHVALDKAIDGLLPAMKESKRERFERIVSVTTMLSFKPIIYGSLAGGIVPLFISIFQSLPETTI